jgi:NhaP-type Na+/H+ or K+/H+ antiporter
MKVELPLLVLSLLVIFSYAFDVLARRTKVPSVLLLLATGIGLRYLAQYFDLSISFLDNVLPLLGTVGLILIVLEGALELKLEKGKKELIGQTLRAAFFILLLTTAGITWLIHLTSEASLRLCFINAIPFAIISSAIAIPSASVLAPDRKEYVVYESSFSDIFGIILFNFAVGNESYGWLAFGKLGLETVAIIILSFLFCLALLYLMKSITHHLKFFLIISVLVLVYAFGKVYHLSSLVIILAFGLLLNNVAAIPFRWFSHRFLYPNFKQDLEQMHILSGESAFLIRTFFFLLFGVSIDFITVFDSQALLQSGLILLAIYGIRWGYQRLFQKKASLTELLLSPRGLISILLYLSIPDSLRIGSIDKNVLLLVVLATALLMTVGLLRYRSTAEPS